MERGGTRIWRIRADLIRKNPPNPRSSASYSPPPVVRPRATSNSLSRGTSMAHTVKPNEPATSKEGSNGSADSLEPGLATRTLVTVYHTTSGQAQLARVKAADGRSALSTHH